MAVTKHNELVRTVERIGPAVHEAFHIASTGRPGPVLVDIPKDLLNTRFDFTPVTEIRLPGYEPPSYGHGGMVGLAAQALVAAARPVLYAGGGVVRAGACAELRELAELADLPVVTTLMARGVFPDGHGLHLGMPGMHGHRTATTAVGRADVLVALGARVDDRRSFAPEAAVVQVDVDAAEIGRNRAVDVPIVGDCRLVLRQIVDAVRAALGHGADRAGTGAWWQALRSWQREGPVPVPQDPGGPLKPQTVVKAVGAALRGDGIVVAGAGAPQSWAARHIGFEHPRSWVTSGGLGTMGFCLPAAIGAKVARGGERVVAIDDAAGFGTTLQELATARTEDVPVVCCVLGTGPGCPDLVRLAEAYGCVGLRCDAPEDVEATLDKALGVGSMPVLVDFRVASTRCGG
jgi:acetolactate synthase-1/2/3 large subunit